MSITLVENFRAVFYAPFYAAFALNAYAREGLEIELKLASDPTSRARFTVSGEGEVSWSGPLRLMHTLEQDPRAGAVAFCEIVQRDPFYLVGREPLRGAFRPAALAGRRLAVVSEVPTPWLCLRHDLRLAGVAENAVERVKDATMAENADRLRAGAVDVIQVFEPFATHLEREGAGHVWYAAAHRGFTAYTTFNTRRAFLEAEPKTALGMCRAMRRTLQWIATHDGAALGELIAGYFPGLDAGVLAAALDRYRANDVWNTSPVPGRPGFEWLRDAAMAGGMLKTAHRFEDCVDDRFARQAMEG